MADDDPQNPLPEASFLWRRLLTFMVVIVALGLTWHAAEALHDLGSYGGLLELAKWTLGFAALIATYYYVAPSAAELTKLVQTARLLRPRIKNEPEKPDFRAAEHDSAPWWHQPLPRHPRGLRNDEDRTPWE